jgi:hypothetical protein
VDASRGSLHRARDFFTRNFVAILAEQRLPLAVKNGTALTYGDFGNVP